MDSSLDEIIASRPKGGAGAAVRGRGGGGRGRRSEHRPPPARAPRREDFPRDGVRKYQRDDRSNIDSDWVHDRYEDDRYDDVNRRARYDEDRYGPPKAAAPNGTRIRIDNVHYDLTEDDLRELFLRIGRIISVRILYDRSDRSQGTAYVVYEDRRDAHRAIAEFDGCNANGQPIHLTLMPSAPAASHGSLMDRAERPPRSLLERTEGVAPLRHDRSDEGRGGRRDRGDSPRRARHATNADVDRYIPGRGSRSPIRRRGTPREVGRRPGQKREDSGRGGRRARTDEEGRPVVGGRPKKTAEELDAEMDDYWDNRAEGATETQGADSSKGSKLDSGPNAAGVAAGDIDMDIIE